MNAARARKGRRYSQVDREQELKDRELTLPVWAQELIIDLRRENEQVDQTLRRTVRAHEILLNRDWFTLLGPALAIDPSEEPEYVKLWVLSGDQPHLLTTLYRGDVLLIGRKKP